MRFSEGESGVFVVESWPVLICTSRANRTVHAPVSALSDPVQTATMSPTQRAELQACLERTRRVQPVLF